MQQINCERFIYEVLLKQLSPFNSGLC